MQCILTRVFLISESSSNSGVTLLVTSEISTFERISKLRHEYYVYDYLY